MRATNIKRTILSIAISLLMSFLLTGCFKGNISVDIKWDGSADVSVALGMTPQAMALISSSNQGTNPFQDMRTSLADSSGMIPSGVQVKQWNDGDYNWMSATKNFSDFNQVNQIMENKKIFNNFSLSRKSFLIVDEYELDAEMAPLASDVSSADTTIDPSTFITMTTSASFPGVILDSNGFQDSKDQNLYTWTAEGHQAVPITIKSLSVDWLGMFILILVVLGVTLLGIYAFGGFDFIFHPKKKVLNVVPQNQSNSQLSSSMPLESRRQPPDCMVELGIEDLLNQVNSRAVNSMGEFRRRPGEMALIWKDAADQQRFIDIKDLGNRQISVNGKNYPATKDNAKAGIMEALKNQKEI